MTFIYTTWNDHRQESRRRLRTIERIDLEISSRLNFFKHHRRTIQHLEDAILLLERPQAAQFPSGVFPEFKDRGLRALLIELQSLVPESEKAEIEKALFAANELARVYLTLSKEPPAPAVLMGQEKLKAMIRLNDLCAEHFNLARWGHPFQLDLTEPPSSSLKD